MCFFYILLVLYDVFSVFLLPSLLVKCILYLVCMFVCMYVWSSHIAEMDQPGKVANPAHGQLNREN